jgi:hypothetical protein
MTDGKLQPPAKFGLHPHGFIMFEPDGYGCGIIVNGDRQEWKDKTRPTDAEKIENYDTLMAACFSYKIDSATSTFTYYPEVAWKPAGYPRAGSHGRATQLRAPVAPTSV